MNSRRIYRRIIRRSHQKLLCATNDVIEETENLSYPMLAMLLHGHSVAKKKKKLWSIEVLMIYLNDQ